MIDLDGLPTRAPLPEPLFLNGGFQIECQEYLGFQINLFSKIAGRVLLRIAGFESRYFDQFEKGLSKLELDKFLDFGHLKNLLNVKIESHKSRLNNEKNLAEALQNVLTKKNIKLSDEAKQTLYIRIEKDKVTVSLDTSGEHLHRRGYSSYRGEAPLRETLAAYMIFKLREVVGSGKQMTLVDPFAGSGTLLFEFLSFNRPNLERDFSWLHFKSTAKLFKSPTWKKNYRWFGGAAKSKCLAFDKDEKSIVNIQKNEADFKRIFEFSEIDLTAKVADSSELDLKPYQSKNPLWIVANPPYGMRLADDGAKDILEKLAVHADGLLVIHPEKWNFKIPNLVMVNSEPFSNQGLKLKLSIFAKP